MRRKKNSRFLICIIWCKKERERAELFFFFKRARIILKCKTLSNRRFIVCELDYFQVYLINLY